MTTDPIKADNMRKFRLSHTMIVALFLAAGCQPTYWYQQGRTFSECKADQVDCQAELLRRTDRHHLTDYERRFMEDCMRQRGYELVPDGDLPVDVRREEPDAAMAVPWNHFYGVAGSIEEPDASRPGYTPAQSALRPPAGDSGGREPVSPAMPKSRVQHGQKRHATRPDVFAGS